MRPHRRQPTRLLHPWDSPGKNAGVGCHFLLQCMKVKSESEVAQLYLTLSNPMDCSLPGSSVHGIFQARILEWGAIAFSAAAAAKWLQSRLTLHDPMDCSLPGSSIHGSFQARVLEWVAIAFSRLPSLEVTNLMLCCIPYHTFFHAQTNLHRGFFILLFCCVLLRSSIGFFT